MSNTHEYERVAQNELYSIWNGSVRTPQGVIEFAVTRPDEVIDDHPLLVAPGFTDGIEGPRRLLNHFAEQGRVAITLKHPRVDHPLHKGDPEGHKADNLHQVLQVITDRNPDLKTLDLVGHSEGGANASRLAVDHPEYVRTITVMASGGLIEGDDFRKIYARALLNPRAMSRVLKHFLLHSSYDLKLAAQSTAYCLQNPRKAMEEALHIAAQDIRPRFADLRNAGIPSAALQFGGDELFPLADVMRGTNNGEIFDSFTVYPHDPNAGHLTPQYHPRKVGAIVLSGISDMEQTTIYNRQHAGVT